MLLVRGIHDLTRDSDSRFLLVNAGYNTDWVISVTCQYLSTYIWKINHIFLN